jgi:hypothetical protein
VLVPCFYFAVQAEHRRARATVLPFAESTL